MKKRLWLAAGGLGFLLGSAWLYWFISHAPETPPASQEIFLPDAAARCALLQSAGCTEPQCIGEEQIRLPAVTDRSYSAYAALQEAQSLPLAAHLGENARRYTYTQSSSGQTHLRTELLVSENGLLLGAMQYDPASPEPVPLLP